MLLLVLCHIFLFLIVIESVCTLFCFRTLRSSFFAEALVYQCVNVIYVFLYCLELHVGFVLLQSYFVFMKLLWFLCINSKIVIVLLVYSY